jgi:hypothetical protein
MCRLQRPYTQKPKCLSFLQTIFSTNFAFSLIQYAHMLMSHIFDARPIMTSCAEFIIRLTSLFLCLLSARFIVSSPDSFAGGAVLLSEDECIQSPLCITKHTLMSCHDLYFSDKQHYNTALNLSEKFWHLSENWKKCLSVLHAVLSNRFNTEGRVKWVGRGSTALFWYENEQDNIT